MRKSKQIKQLKNQAAIAYCQGKKKEAYQIREKAAKLRLELQKKN